ncbi:kinase-like domain-containing protein [Rhizophagus clarus]|uniref:Kinase-like domain-containing protein n=1 Tax=Rhizophagus clarus TaxID=94130 RepID=A0A8H3QC73_9GLOM|nr:kinase-like domain-containing protein [Rhizophagus clarus]
MIYLSFFCSEKEVALKCLNNLNENNLSENLDDVLNEWDCHEKCLDLMEKCWNEDPLKRPSTSEVENIIGNWIYRPIYNKISEELKSNIMEFINAPIGNNNLAVEPHPQAYYTSRVLDFTSKELSKCLDCLIDDIESSGM